MNVSSQYCFRALSNNLTWGILNPEDWRAKMRCYGPHKGHEINSKVYLFPPLLIRGRKNLPYNPQGFFMATIHEQMFENASE